ncbi:MAG: thioredoxin fold domain-containing protein [Acidobacteria bacterium]|nr:thioredoxin fold domain-containing protein [Acidobacteriota bacterium]
MNKTQAKEHLEVLTNLAVLLAAVSILAVLTLNYFGGRKPVPQIVEGLQKGQQFPAIPGVDYRGSASTLLVAMSTECGYCTQSIPFYNQLADMKNTGKISLRTVALFPNLDDEVQQYTRQHQLKTDHKSSVDFGQLKLAGTPTMILVDQNGRVINFWVGALKPDAQRQFLNSLETQYSAS